MADKTGYIGRNPGDSSVTIARQTYTPTSNTTDFTFNSGYTVGLCDVYLNGVKLVDSRDYEANSGTTVGLTSEAISGDIVEIIAYKAFNLGNVTDATSNFTVGSNLSVGSTATLSGVVTTGGDLYVGGDLYGDGSNLTGIANTAYVDAINITASGIVTASSGVKIPGGELQVGIAVTVGAAGVTTFSKGVHLDGPTAIGKGNAFQLENGFENENAQILNDGATEKATIVFKTSSGGTVSERLRIKDTGDVDLSGSAAGVSSVTWDASADSLIFKDSTSLNFGNSNDLQISHTRDLASQNDSEGVSVVDNWTSYINENGTGGLVLKSNGNSGEGAFQFFDTGWRPLARMFSGSNASTKLYQAGLERFATTSAGINVTGISSATQSIHVAETIYADGGTGIITATQYKGDGSALTGVGGEFDITSCLFI